MSFFKDLVGKLTNVLNVVAPIAALIPGMQWLSIAAMAANVVQGLMQKPPNWGQILTNVAMQAIPMGFGKALKSFGAAFPKGGTAMNFAEHFSTKMAETLKGVAKEVGPRFGPQFAQQMEMLSAKLATPEYLQKFAEVVNKATGTTADELLNENMISRAAANIGPQFAEFTGGLGGQLGYKLTQALSTFATASAESPVTINPVGGEPVVVKSTQSIKSNAPLKG